MRLLFTLQSQEVAAMVVTTIHREWDPRVPLQPLRHLKCRVPLELCMAATMHFQAKFLHNQRLGSEIGVGHPHHKDGRAIGTLLAQRRHHRRKLGGTLLAQRRR